MEERLYIENFGPIIKADISISRVTILTGRQGAGKSTVAKLYALFTWLEKALMRRSLTIKYITQYNRFRKQYCAYNNIDNYFTDTTVLKFIGSHYSFSYRDKKLNINNIENLDETAFYISKVMYVPAERSILGSIDHPSQLKGLGASMSTFSDEFGYAKTNIKSGYTFPFEKIGFEYDTLNDMPKLKLTGGAEIKLSAGSSGFQSSLPLLLVSKNLNNMVLNSSQNTDLSDKELKALQKEVGSILNNRFLSEEVKIASLQTISSRFKYSRFVNIVEEMELNLFPDSQKGVLYELIETTLTLEKNRLMLTTHSPYVINYITLAIKAYELSHHKGINNDLRTKINDIVPTNSQISASDVTIYELGDGKATRLAYYEGIPSDDNFLNDKLNDTNTIFDALLEIEDELN